MNQRYRLELCGRELTFAFRYPETLSLFQKYKPPGSSIRQRPADETDAAEGVIRVDASDWPEYEKLGMPPGPATEFSILTEYCSDALLAEDCVIIHAAALRWMDRAYLICGQSGVGKSTQARFLQELRPGAFAVICGDRPVLEFCHSERSAAESKNPSSPIIVHPSFWNGKENWHGGAAAPLAGLILLERGEENRLDSLTPREAALKLYPQFIHSGWRAENIRRVAALATRLLDAVPIWRLSTNRVPDSTKLLLEAVF